MHEQCNWLPEGGRKNGGWRSTGKEQYRHVDTESDRCCGMERVLLVRLSYTIQL